MFALRSAFNRGSLSLLRRQFAVVTKFSKEHEWVTFDDSTKIGNVGITDHAQNELGDIVFLKLPDVNSTCKQNDIIGEIESVKAVANLYSPVSGTITEVNKTLESDFGVLNKVDWKTYSGSSEQLDLQGQG